MTAPALPVLFRAERSGPFRGEVTAVFPTMAADYAGREFVTYAHVGQHGGGTREWLQATRPARPDEFAELLAELRTIYETRPAAAPEIYGEPVRLVVVARITSGHRAAWQASAREARDGLRADPSGGPWSPAAREATAAAMAADRFA